MSWLHLITICTVYGAYSTQSTALHIFFHNPTNNIFIVYGHHPLPAYRVKRNIIFLLIVFLPAILYGERKKKAQAHWWLHNASNYNFDFFMMKLLLLEIIPRDFEFHTRKIFASQHENCKQSAAKVGEEENF